MVDPKEEPLRQSRKTSAGRTPTADTPNAPDTNSPASAAQPASDNLVGARQRRYLIAPRSSPGMAPMSTDSITNIIQNMPDVTIVRHVKSAGFGALSFGGAAGTAMPDVVVAEMSVERGEALRNTAPPNIIVEEDKLLQHSMDDLAFRVMSSAVQAAVLPAPVSAEVQLRIVGDGNKPLPKATVYLYGTGFPTQGVTDGSGLVTLTVSGGPIETVQAIYVKPVANHWERFITRPALVERTSNTIALTPLNQTFQGFPQTGSTGWGQKLIGFDQLAQGFTGRGVKIAIINSGCDNTHPQLTHVRNGVDFTNGGDQTSWTQDEISHGTHCAGIIGASSAAVQGIRGFVPEAEIHAFKVFPGGRFSNLIDALDECIQREIDVVNMSLGSGQASELVTRKIVEATSQGVACIVAAGNSGGPVQFPGTLPNVLTVSAVGQLGTFPPDTFHAQAVLPTPSGIQGMFPAKFSCFGPSIDVCGPGVAILSCVPGGYAAWDGTSMATPHITGLAALILAHHPVFQGPTKQRSGARVDQLFQIIKAASIPVVADVMRGGAGMPSLQFAVGAGIAAVPPQVPPPQQSAAIHLPGGQSVQAPPSGSFPPQQPGMIGLPIAAASAQQQMLAAILSNPALLQILAQMRAVGLI